MTVVRNAQLNAKMEKQKIANAKAVEKKDVREGSASTNTRTPTLNLRRQNSPLLIGYVNANALLRMRILLAISLPQKLLFVVLFSLLFGNYLPVEAKSFFYTISLLFKSGLVFVLPAIIFACIFSSLTEMKFKGAVTTLLVILFGICFSNFTSACVAFSLSKYLFSAGLTFPMVSTGAVTELSPLWNLNIQPLISNDKALFSGLLLSIALKLWVSQGERIGKVAVSMKEGSLFVLNRVFIPIIPLFVLGFALKLQHDQILFHILSQYSLVLSLIVIILALYLGLLYWIGSGFSLRRFRTTVQNIAPSVISGFSTMSSMAALPLTLEAAEKNTKNPRLSRMVIPMTVNNHLV